MRIAAGSAPCTGMLRVPCRASTEWPDTGQVACHGRRCAPCTHVTLTRMLQGAGTRCRRIARGAAGSIPHLPASTMPCRSPLAESAHHPGDRHDRAAGGADRGLGAAERVRRAARRTAAPRLLGAAVASARTFIGLLLAGVIIYLVLSIKAINLNRRQSNFIDSVTHELKSPIASMKLYLQTLAPPPGEPGGAGRASTASCSKTSTGWTA